MSVIQNLFERIPTRTLTEALSSKFGYRDILQKDDDCISGDCDDFGPSDYYTINEKVEHLPFIHQSADLKARLILSQGYEFFPKDSSLLKDMDDKTKEKIENDRRLIGEIFQRENEIGQSLHDLLYTVIVESELYGHCGLQAYDFEKGIDNIFWQIVHWNQFMMISNKLTRASRGRRSLLYYLIDTRGFAGEENITLNFQDVSLSGKANVDGKYRYKALPLEFTHIRLNTESAYGVSPLYYDQLITTLIMDILKDNIQTVNNDGWKGIVIKGRQGIKPSSLGLKTEELSSNWQDEIISKFLQSIRKAIQGKNNKDNILYLNGSLVESYEKHDRGFKSIEYMKLVENKSSVLAASMLGLLAAFLGDRDTTYASNIGEAIKFAVQYTISPSQEKYSKQITEGILNKYINNQNTELNYEYEFVLNPIDLTDPVQQSETLNGFADFATKLRGSAFATINEAIEFLNDVIPEINLSQIDNDINDAGDIKTTEKELIPVNFEDI